MRKHLRSRRGQGMTEYIIIIAVIAILTLGIVTRFGDSIRQLFVGSTAVLSGGEADPLENKADPSQIDQTLGGNWGQTS